MPTKPKYKLTDESITVDGFTLYRIKALKNFADVKKGDLGGFVQSTDNLSQEGDCWVYDQSCAYNTALITGCHNLSDNTRVCNKM